MYLLLFFNVSGEGITTKGEKKSEQEKVEGQIRNNYW